jgi:hypothetical protein
MIRPGTTATPCCSKSGMRSNVSGTPINFIHCENGHDKRFYDGVSLSDDDELETLD